MILANLAGATLMAASQTNVTKYPVNVIVSMEMSVEEIALNVRLQEPSSGIESDNCTVHITQWLIGVTFLTIVIYALCNYHQ